MSHERIAVAEKRSQLIKSKLTQLCLTDCNCKLCVFWAAQHSYTADIDMHLLSHVYRWPQQSRYDTCTNSKSECAHPNTCTCTCTLVLQKSFHPHLLFVGFGRNFVSEALLFAINSSFHYTRVRLHKTHWRGLTHNHALTASTAEAYFGFRCTQMHSEQRVSQAGPLSSKSSF